MAAKPRVNPILVLKDADGVDREICFTPNALCAAEEAMDKSISQLDETSGMRELRALLWAGMWGARERREGLAAPAPMTLREAGPVMSTLIKKHGTTTLMEKLGGALEAAMPSSPGGKSGKGKTAPKP